MTVVVTALFYPLPEAKQQLVDALKATMAGVHAQDAGCELYAIHDSEDGTITMIEKWESRELLEIHSSSAATIALQQAVAEFVAQPALVTTMTPIPAGDERKGML